MRHINWVESLMVYRKHVKGDWMKVFARALDIYHGKVKGFKGMIDDNQYRQHLMKADLKLLIKDIINEVIGRWRSGKS